MTTRGQMKPSFRVSSTASQAKENGRLRVHSPDSDVKLKLEIVSAATDVLNRVGDVRLGVKFAIKIRMVANNTSLNPQHGMPAGLTRQSSAAGRLGVRRDWTWLHVPPPSLV